MLGPRLDVVRRPCPDVPDLLLRRRVPTGAAAVLWLIKGVAVKVVGDTDSVSLVKGPARWLLSPRCPST
ncbi:hypothetical protein Franean1_1460 [Parafrankia sp. EAN1pec]|nr:hypothetical protein Franean1_1460 [Frankia sp. EAN1pec]